MHIPVLLAGFLVGPVSGIVVGLLAPLLSHLLTGMPPTYAVPLMSLELPIYGLIAGLAYRRLKMNIYVSLVIAMIFGRIMFGMGLLVLVSFFSFLWVRIYVLEVGYQISHTLEQHEKLFQENRKLRIERASLSDPSRIEEIAKKNLGMVEPNNRQVVVLKW